MSLYADYVFEREGFKTLEKESGFAIYRIEGEVCYIRDIYVKPEYRKKGLSYRIADEVCIFAKSADCKQLLGSVSLDLPSATASMKMLLGYGMEYLRTVGDMQYYKKEI